MYSEPEVVKAQHTFFMQHLLHAKLLKRVFQSKTITFLGGGGGRNNNNNNNNKQTFQ